MSTTFVGCQPIFKANLDVYAYEILFRNSAVNLASIIDGDQATAQLIINTFTDIGLENVVGNRPAFINVTRNFVLDGHAHALPKERVVLEVLEDIQPDPEIIHALRALSACGYRIALDDFVYSAHLQPLIDLADIVKVELPAIAIDDLAEHVAILRRSNVQLLAEKIETHEEFDRCRDLGFDFYQGYFLSRPRVISGNNVAVNRVAALQLMNTLFDPDVTTEQLVETVGADPSLCYKLLRYVNSASVGLLRNIDSVRAAVILLGFKRLRSFASLVLLATVSGSKPMHLIVMALTRARMCEQLAIAARKDRPDVHFITGMFSALDALLDQPIEEALNAVPLSESISDAIINADGPLANVLTCVLSYERADWDAVRLPGIDADTIRAAYLESLEWATQLTSTMFHPEDEI